MEQRKNKILYAIFCCVMVLPLMLIVGHDLPFCFIPVYCLGYLLLPIVAITAVISFFGSSKKSKLLFVISWILLVFLIGMYLAPTYKGP